MTMPNFLIAGAAKSGTTSLWHYLKQHPDVFMPVNKEPMFLAASYYDRLNPEDPKYGLLKHYLVSDLAAYESLFAGAGRAKAIGEATAPYLYHHDLVVPRAKELLGDPRILIILRNPVERAISAYTFLLRDGEEAHSLDECLELEDARMAANWSMSHAYRGAGLYSRQVRAFRDGFSRVKVYLYEDLVRDALGLVRDMYGFLGVDPAFSPDVETRHNISGVPTNRWVHHLLGQPNALRRMVRPFVRMVTTEPQRRRIVEGLRGRFLRRLEVPDSTRRRLRDLFREDVLALQDLIGRDLSAWME